MAGKCPSVPRRCFTLVGDDVWGEKKESSRVLKMFLCSFSTSLSSLGSRSVSIRQFNENQLRVCTATHFMFTVRNRASGIKVIVLNTFRIVTNGSQY